MIVNAPPDEALYRTGPPQKLMGKFTSEKEPVDQYLRFFSWNKVKYRVEKPIGELIDTLHKVSAPRVITASLFSPLEAKMKKKKKKKIEDKARIGVRAMS